MKINSAIAQLLFIPFILLTIILIACSENVSNTQAETDPSIQAVKNSITEVSASGRNYQTGPLEGGTAVLVDDLAAYWVSQGTVYAANGHAKAWSPDISYASSEEVNFNTVKAAVQ